MKKLVLILILLKVSQLSYCQTDFAYHLPENTSEKELIVRIIENGDTSAYHNLYNYFMNHKEIGQVLSYSLIMANKWDYSVAMYDVYSELLILYDCIFWGNIEIMDSRTRKLALEYLIRYYENSPECMQRESAYKYHILKYVEKKYLKVVEGRFIITDEH